jgi:hypothetical protein
MGWASRHKKETHMSTNGKTPLPFQAPAGTPLIGQPFSILTVGIPMNLTLTCNCGVAADRPVLTILLSAPVACPACGKTYAAFFNPQNGQIQMIVGLPPVEQVPS